MITQWDKTDQELSQELNKNSNVEIQRQTETLGRLLKIVGEAIGENKEVKVENIGREILNKIRLEKPEWIGELKQDTSKLEKRLDYIASAIIRKEVVKEVGLKRPDWIKELIPKEIKFPEPKEAEKLIPILKEVLNEIKSIEIPDEISIKGQVEIKEPRWLKFPDIEKPILSLAKFLKGLQEKIFKVNVENEITVRNQVREVTILNPQKEVKITNLAETEKALKLLTSQMQALGQTGSNGGGSSIDVSTLATDPYAAYQLYKADANSNPIYICKVDRDGKWLIKKIDTSTFTAEFAKGDSDVETNYNNRASLTYVSFNNLT